MGDFSSTGGLPCAIVLPSNELMVMKGQTAFKAALKCKLYYPATIDYGATYLHTSI